MRYGYAVVEINQASQQPEHVRSLCWDRAEAEAIAQDERAHTARMGRRERHVVCELVEVKD